MPVMKQFRIGSATYDTVGEASVTQVQTSGTKIATVTIDGTATDLYAPEGGGGGSTVTVTPILTSGTQTATIDVDGTTSTLYAPTPPTVPSASTTTPLMDGTASYGSGTDYARANHVHPTDTSRQATLVSGTNIKTVNGNSLLGSGDITTPTYTLPTASTSTLGGVKVDGSTITIADGVISSSGGGGGGLVINVVVDSSGNVVSHDATTATCLDFAQAAVNNSDALAVAYVREYSYDDEDDIYNSYVYRLPLINAGTTSYGGGQYAADGGVQLSFSCVSANIKGASKMFIRARRLEIYTTNDDPETPVSITYTNKEASSNS